MDGKFTEKLIEAVKRRPVLYLYKHPDYKNKVKTLRAWKGIQNELNEDVELLKSKWKNLKDTYKKCKNSRQGVGVKLVNWTWADEMSFLDTAILDATVTVKEEQTTDNEESDNDLDSTSSHNKEIENRETEDILKRFEMSVFQNSDKKYMSLKRKRSEQTDGNAKKNCTRSNDDRDDIVEVGCDRVDLLFLGLAHSFKNLSHRTQITTKFNLVKVLMDAELSDLQDKE